MPSRLLHPKIIGVTAESVGFWPLFATLWKNPLPHFEWLVGNEAPLHRKAWTRELDKIGVANKSFPQISLGPSQKPEQYPRCGANDNKIHLRRTPRVSWTIARESTVMDKSYRKTKSLLWVEQSILSRWVIIQTRNLGSFSNESFENSASKILWELAPPGFSYGACVEECGLALLNF